MEYLKKVVKDKVNCLVEDKHQSFLEIVDKVHAQSTHSNMFAVSFQCLKEEVRGEVDCLHTEKHQSFLQVDTFFFGCKNLELPKITDLQYLRNDVLDYLNLLYVNRLPSHAQSM